MTLEESSRPFRFGLVTTSGTEASKTAWTSYAQRVEQLGFDVLQVADHFGNSTVCTPRLAAAAAVTTTLRLGSYVYDNDFRHPVLLAREAAEIDRLSGGRMELGIGAGWSRSEYEMVGIAFDEGPVRASRYEEAVEIVRRLHQGETLDWAGEHYRLNGCELLVEPVQQPIPLVFGLHRSSDEIPLEDWASREVASTSPYYLVGDSARVVDEILARRDRWGISHWTFWEEDLDAAAPSSNSYAAGSRRRRPRATD